MPVTPSFRTYVEDQLGHIVPVRTRSMFGGLGIYAGDLFFALVADDVLYLKVDEETRRTYEERGLGYTLYPAELPNLEGEPHGIGVQAFSASITKRLTNIWVSFSA